MMGWAAWLGGSLVCLMVWAKWLQKLPESLSTLLWWIVFGLLVTPAPHIAGADWWSPALITAAFDMLNHADGGVMRAGKPLLFGALIGAGVGVVSMLLKTRQRISNVG